MKEVENILRILRETLRFIKEDKPQELKVLSGQTIHSATISQDGDNIVVAVLVYSLGKFLERDHYKKMEGWDGFYKVIIKNLELTIKSLEKNEIENVRIYLGRIRHSLNKISGDLGKYIRK